MTPNQLAKSGSEHGEQVALFAWAAVARMYGFEAADLYAQGVPVGAFKDSMFECKPVPALEWLHAIPNGGSRGDDAKSRAIRGGALKAEGVRTGIADIFLPAPRQSKLLGLSYSGLYIEMKKPDLKPKKAESKGGLSDEQIAFRDYALSVGYGWKVCYTWREAADTLRSYIEWKG